MNIEEYFKRMQNIEEKLLNFLEQEDRLEENYENYLKILNDENILKDRFNLKIILSLINKISNNHYRCHNFIDKIKQIIKDLKKQIQQFYSNDEIFSTFKTNKLILLFLIEEKMLTIDQNIYDEMMQIKYRNLKYPEYFSPEIETFIEEEKNKENFDINLYNRIQDNLKEDFETFNEKRKKGENDDYLSKIIQNDSIKDFIIFINKESYSVNSHIEKSIFETNEFLNRQKEIKLIEYAAFYGSVQIFKYLYKNESEMSSKLWLYAIHGNDEEIIGILEDKKIKLEYEQCIEQSIKFHHNFITNYIEENFKENNQNTININSYYFKHYNLTGFIDKIKTDDLFFYACKYDYYKIVEYLLKNKKRIDFNNNDKSSIKAAANKNNNEILTLLLSKFNKNSLNNCFIGCKKLKRISIPSFITSIECHAFFECSSLTQITIPSSVNSIGDYAFSECSSLKQITIPSSVTSIGDYVFRGCTSLKQILIPSSVTLIGNSSFRRCSSLTQILIPFAVTSIGDFAFAGCSSLAQIELSSSLKFIGNNTFEDCTKLTQISIPPSLKFIGNNAFKNCSKLAQITIPSTFGVNNIGLQLGIKITRI